MGKNAIKFFHVQVVVVVVVAAVAAAAVAVVVVSFHDIIFK